MGHLQHPPTPPETPPQTVGPRPPKGHLHRVREYGHCLNTIAEEIEDSDVTSAQQSRKFLACQGWNERESASKSGPSNFSWNIKNEHVCIQHKGKGPGRLLPASDGGGYSCSSGPDPSSKDQEHQHFSSPEALTPGTPVRTALVQPFSVPKSRNKPVHSSCGQQLAPHPPSSSFSLWRLGCF